MPVRENDIWVVTFPKCGTTWTQEMVWQIANNVDIDGGNPDKYLYIFRNRHEQDVSNF